jgi:4-alpha-glucanotransferase
VTEDATPDAEIQTPSARLTELARSFGVATDYWDWRGRHVDVSSATIRSVLGALGVDASSDEAVERIQHARTAAAWKRVLPPVVVLRSGWTPWVAVHIPDGATLRARVDLELGGTREVEQVDNWVAPREVDGVSTGEATVKLPADLPLGYHTLTVEYGDLRTDAEQEDPKTPVRTAMTTVIVTPDRVELPEKLQERRAWGLAEQLYSVRSELSWGIGDAADLAELGTWAARQGADFVQINPVHAAEPVPVMEPSPYLPSTRRFVNPIYIRIEEIPELGYLSAAEHQLVEWHADDARRLNAVDQLDRDGVWESKLAALRIVFRIPPTHRRRRAFEEFCEREGQALQDYATWCAIAGERGLPWSDWPLELQDPSSEQVVAERERLAEEVEFQCWLQWIVQSQFTDAQRELLAGGMSIGVIQDLAVGVHPGGADAWSYRKVLASGVSVGAPPDDYTPLGQNWSQPPWRPDQLAEQAYAPYRDMLRATLRMAGAIRVDHILGLFRLWWVPAGMDAREGTYVRYDHEAMVGILALEAQRAGAIVIGEDLGTLEEWVRDYLRERGILGTSIVWFERTADGGPKLPEQYRELALSSVTTHDLPPTAGYLQGEHVRVRHELGMLEQPLEEVTSADEEQREKVLGCLRERGLLTGKGSVEDQVDALYRFLAAAPSKLLAISVNDLVGDVRTINQPGTDEEYPNWRVPLAGPDRKPISLEQVMVSRRAKRLIRCVS